jgi:hypothetical protein
MMAFDTENIQDVGLSPLEYVIHLGTQGNHVLFDTERIRKAFAKEEEELACLGNERVEEVREAIRNIFSLPEFESKRDYISSLPTDIQDVLVYLYFQMIEKSIHLHQKSHH